MLGMSTTSTEVDAITRASTLTSYIRRTPTFGIARPMPAKKPKQSIRESQGNGRKQSQAFIPTEARTPLLRGLRAKAAAEYGGTYRVLPRLREILKCGTLLRSWP